MVEATQARDASLPNGQTTHLLGALGTLLARRWRRVLFVSVMSVAAALIYNAAHGPIYTARLRVLVAPGGSSLANAQTQAEGDASTLVIADHGQAARNLAALLSDPGFIVRLLPAPVPEASAAPVWARLMARRTAERLGLSAGMDAREDVGAGLARGFSATALGDTDVVELVLRWGDRHFVAAGLEAIAVGTQRAVGDAGAARAALAQASSRVAEAQAALDALDARGGPPADDGQVPRQRAAILARLDTARAQADQIRLTINLARHASADVDADYRGGGWVAAAEAGAAPSKAGAKFAALLEKKQALTSAPTPDARAVAAIDSSIAQLRVQNYRQIHAHYADEIAAAQGRLTPLTGAIAEDEASLRALDAREAEALLVTEDRAARLARLAEEKKRLRQARQRIDGAWQEVGAVRVLSRPPPPAEPDWPAPWVVLRGAVLAGIGAGLLSAAVAEHRRRTIVYASDITCRLGVEVLACLGEEPG